jgi:hypothetical protein
LERTIAIFVHFLVIVNDETRRRDVDDFEFFADSFNVSASGEVYGRGGEVGQERRGGVEREEGGAPSMLS